MRTHYLNRLLLLTAVLVSSIASNIYADSLNEAAIQGLLKNYYGDLSVIRVVGPEIAGSAIPEGGGLFQDLVRLVYEPIGIQVDYALDDRMEAVSRVMFHGFADAVAGGFILRDDTLYQFPSAALSSANGNAKIVWLKRIISRKRRSCLIIVCFR